MVLEVQKLIANLKLGFFDHPDRSVEDIMENYKHLSEIGAVEIWEASCMCGNKIWFQKLFKHSDCDR